MELQIIMKVVDKIMIALVVVGALNWGSVGLFSFDFVQAICGDGSALSRIVFALVGISGLWCISLLFRREHVERD